MAICHIYIQSSLYFSSPFDLIFSRVIAYFLSHSPTLYDSQHSRSMSYRHGIFLGARVQSVLFPKIDCPCFRSHVSNLLEHTRKHCELSRLKRRDSREMDSPLSFL